MNRPPCPRCDQTTLIFKNGSYKLASGAIVQRWFCQRCRKAFSPAVQEIAESTSETSVAHPMHGC
ncbi:hypothetical protein NSTC731_00013 [Nostoc sp. DSM 114167]|jgi:transposase-like protein